MSDLWKPSVESISDDHLKCPLILFLPRVPSLSLSAWNRSPAHLRARAATGKGRERRERAQIRGSLSDFTAPFRVRVRVRDNGMGCQISKLPELVGLLLPVGTATEAIVMTTVIYQWILKCWFY